MGSKGSNTSTTTSTPNPQAASAYNQILQRSQQVGQLPYTPVTQGTAPVNEQQYAGIGGINQYANAAQPAIAQGESDIAAATNPNYVLDTTGQYLTPYLNQVVGSTEAQFQNQNAQQQQGIVGNAIAQGALGGNRSAIAQAETANQENLAQAPVIAGLENQAYTNALGTAVGQQQNLENAAYGLGNLGVSGQQAGLTGAGAQIQAGGLEQQTQQAALNALYTQQMQQQTFPYQQASWLAGIDTGVGGQMGGTSTTTGPPPSMLSQLGGLGAAGLGLFGSTGAVQGIGNMASGAGSWLSALPLLAAADGGAIKGYADGGSPYDVTTAGGISPLPYGGSKGYIPNVQINSKTNIPKPPQIKDNSQQQAQSIQNLTKAIMGTDGQQPTAQQDEAQDAAQDAEEGLRYGGGISRGYADGGMPENLYPDIYSNFGLNPNIPNLPVGSSGVVPEGDWAEGPSSGILGPNDRVSPKGDREHISGDPVDLDKPDIRGPAVPADQPPPPAPALPPAQNIPSPADGVGVYANNQGISPQRDLMSYADDHGQQQHKTAEEKLAGGLFSGIDLSSNSKLWPALMAAGFGAMSSRSPFAGVAIGEGGLEGVKTYNTLAQQETATRLKQSEIDQKAKELQQRVDASERPYNQLTAFQKEQLAQGKLAPGWRSTPGGGQEFIPGGPADPVQIKAAADAKRNTSGLLDDDTVHNMAEAMHQGDRSVFMNMGAGATKAENVARVWNEYSKMLKDEGKSGTEIAAARADFQAQTAAARALAVRQGNVSASVAEAQQTFPLALQRSAQVPRGQWVPINKVMQMWREGTSSPEQARFAAANQAVITAYGQAMSRTGVNTVHAQTAAEHQLSTVTSPEAYEATIHQLEQEMHAAEVAPETVRQSILNRIRLPNGSLPPTSSQSSNPPPKVEPAVRFRQLIDGGMSRSDAHATMQREGY